MTTIPDQVISTEEPLQGVSGGARDRVRAGVAAAVKKAKARVRESAARHKAALTTGNKPGISSTSNGEAPMIPIGVPVPVRS
jgi:hypothetical protein